MNYTYGTLFKQNYRRLIKYGYQRTLDDNMTDTVNTGNLELVKKYVESGARINAFGDYGLRTAAGRGDLEMVKYFVENGANTSVHANAPLNLATVGDHTDVVDYLRHQMGLNT